MVPIGGISQISGLVGTATDNLVLGLSGGRYVVFFTAETSIGGGTSGVRRDLYYRMFDAAGDPLTADIRLETGSSPRLTDLVKTPDGFAVSYGVTTGQRLALFTDSGAVVGSPVEVTSSTIATLTSGTIASVYVSNGALNTQILNANGTPAGAPQVGAQLPAGAFLRTADVIGLSDGSFFAVLAVTVSDGSGVPKLRGQHFAADGSPLGPNFVLAPLTPTQVASSVYQIDARLAALPGGRFVAVWQTNDTSGAINDTNIRAQLFNADGSAVGPSFVVAATTRPEAEPRVTSDAAGRFVIAWSDSITTKAQAYNPDGSPLGAMIDVNPVNTYVHGTPSLAFLSDGSLEIVWGFRREAARFSLDDSYDRSVIEGTIFTDILTGNDQNNLFRPKGGLTPNTAYPNTGFGSTYDAIDGMGGIDTVDFSASSAAIMWGAGPPTDSDGRPIRLVSIENIIATAFDDMFSGTDAANRLEGGAGNDTITTGRGGDTILGGAGSDTVVYTDSNGTVQVNLTLQRGYNNYADSDTYESIENATGSNFADILIGDGAVNRLDGAAGNDLLIGALGADVLVGGADADTASYVDSIGTVFVNLTLGQGFNNSAEGDSYTGIENVEGSRFADVFIGDAGANRLDGAAGDDTLIGALGADVLVGGDGIDTASYEDNQGGVFVNLLAGTGANNAAAGDSYVGIENLTGTIYNDGLLGDAGANRIDGSAGDDILLGGLGADTLIGGAGTDTVSYEDNQGAVIANLATGQGFGNAAQGDTFSGIENLVGTVFYDQLIGDGGANRLDGGRGADLLTGNGGADEFRFTTAIDGVINVDRITDFTPGQDRIVLDNAIFFGISDGAFGPNTLIIGPVATGGQNRIVYDPTTGNLWFDDDGVNSDPPILFAVLETKPTLTAADFFVV